MERLLSKLKFQNALKVLDLSNPSLSERDLLTLTSLTSLTSQA